jgi:hypothetical protein
MIFLPYLRKHPKAMQYLIGITSSQFDSLLARFSPVLRHQELLWLTQPRLRLPGGGRKPTLGSDLEKLFFLLFYYKTYPAFRFASALFDLDKRNVQIWVRRLEPVVFGALGYELELHTTRVRNFDHWFSVCPQLREFIVDCSERQIRRPKDGELQEFYYSGKKKRHTVKNQILVNPRDKKILHVSATVEGKRHDKQVFEDSWVYTRIPRKAKALGDSAYQGIHRPFLRLTTPQKKPPHQELSELAKHNNKAISQIRVRVEHPFSYLKHFNILSQVFRGQIKRADLPFKTIACIYNYTRNC